MRKLLAFSVFLFLTGCNGFASAADYQWDLPMGMGSFQLPHSVYDALPILGEDFVQKKLIVGTAAQMLTLFKDIYGYGGVVGEFHSNTPNIQPYAALGTDVAKYIPGLNQITDLQIHGFGRYDPGVGGDFSQHLGAGLSLAWKFKT